MQSAFAECDERLRASGETYPFFVRENSLVARDGARGTIYVFLLLLSTCGKDSGPARSFPERVFEFVCTEAAASYYGGTSQGAQSFHFGFPRTLTPRRFGSAVDCLCERMGEGNGHRDSPVARIQKDARLDIVVWKDFDDKLPGKLIGFGQCATGNDWCDKRTDLQPLDWCKLWMREIPVVQPQKMFFVPHRIEPEDWISTNTYAGIAFDRCRISRHACSIVPEHARAAKEWSAHVLKRLSRQH